MLSLSFDVFIRFLLALVLGALIGLEREYVLKKRKLKGFAGVRTFIIIALFGAIIGFFAQEYSYWFIIVAVLGFFGFSVAAYYLESMTRKSIGATTEISSLVTMLIGVLCTLGHLQLAIVLAIVVTAVLALKDALHKFAKSIDKREIYSTLKFAIVAFVILPFLPNKTYGPLNVFNPYIIWLFVVFISGISFVAYILMKALGPKKGLVLTGILGGFVSSTGVALSMAEKSKILGKLSKLLAFAVIVACSTMLIRILIIVAFMNKAMIKTILFPFIAMAISGFIAALILWVRSSKTKHGDITIDVKSPFTLTPALKFAALLLVILFISKLGFLYFGTKGVYITSILSGIGIDAIAISLSQMFSSGEVSQQVASISLVLAAITNIAIKGGIAYFFGEKEFSKKIAIIFLIMILVGLGCIPFI